MIRKDAPKWFVESLKRYDNTLRVRWSYEKGKFAIEQKCPRSVLFKPVKYMKTGNGDGLKEVMEPEYSERYIQYHDAYSTIIYCKVCSLAVLEQVRSMDLARSHRLKRVKDEADMADMARKKREEKELENNRHAMANDMYDTIKRKVGDTVVVGSDKVSDSNWY